MRLLRGWDQIPDVFLLHLLWAEGAVEERSGKGRRVLLQLFCAMAGPGEECALLIYSQWGFLPAPVLSSQNPKHRVQQQTVVSYRQRKLPQREALEMHGSGISYFILNYTLLFLQADSTIGSSRP